jgi:hypothetical protein
MRSDTSSGFSERSRNPLHVGCAAPSDRTLGDAKAAPTSRRFRPPVIFRPSGNFGRPDGTAVIIRLSAARHSPHATPSSSSANGTRSTWASRRRLRIDTFRSPRSTEPMKVRCRWQFAARSACVHFRARRCSRSRWPRLSQHRRHPYIAAAIKGCPLYLRPRRQRSQTGFAQGTEQFTGIVSTSGAGLRT